MKTSDVFAPPCGHHPFTYLSMQLLGVALLLLSYGVFASFEVDVLRPPHATMAGRQTPPRGLLPLLFPSPLVTAYSSWSLTLLYSCVWPTWTNR